MVLEACVSHSVHRRVSLVERDPSGHRPPPGQRPPGKEHGTRQPDRKCHHTETPTPMDIMTDMCKKITLPLTSFAGGN